MARPAPHRQPAEAEARCGDAWFTTMPMIAAAASGPVKEE